MNKYLLNENKFNEFYELYLYSFNRKDSTQRKEVLKERFDHSLAYGIMNKDKLGSGLLSIPFDVDFHGVEFKMDGIGDVMSAPEYGGRGGASTLMKAALEDMYKNKVTLSYLAPFSFGYYRQFGYEEVFDHTNISIESKQLPKISSSKTGFVERIKFSEFPEAAKKLYFENNHQGGVIRADWWWQHMIHKHPEYQVALAFDDQEELIGYLIYYSQDATFVIHEWVNFNVLSYQLLMKFVVKHQSIFEKFVYESPDADFKADLFEDPYALHLEVQPYMMARIVNLQDFIKRYPISKMNLSKITFKVNDSLEKNNHVWSLTVNSGVVDLQIADELKPDFELNIQALTKAMFGYRSLESQSNYGRVQGDIDKIKEFDELFVRTKPQLIDYF